MSTKLQRNLWMGLLVSLVLTLEVSFLPFLGQVAKRELRLATTTSTENSGLLDALLLPFEESYGIKVEVIAVGTGTAIRIAKDGNADVILVPARNLEDEFIAQGYRTKRYQVMHNDFVIVGPAEDVAKIESKKDALRTLKTISTSKAGFVSRGNNSGTQIKERSLWEISGIKPEESWCLQSGSGMASTLRIANEKRTYTLSDRGTSVHS